MECGDKIKTKRTLTTSNRIEIVTIPKGTHGFIKEQHKHYEQKWLIDFLDIGYAFCLDEKDFEVIPAETKKVFNDIDKWPNFRPLR